MRRKNRQVTDWKEIKEIVGRCKVARLGMNDDGKVYVVPMNYGCETEDGGRLTFYFHCAREGRKMDVLKKNPQVCLELDGKHELMEAEVPCGYSYYFESLIGNGRVEMLSEPVEKVRALRIIMKQQTGKDFCEFHANAVQAVCVLKVELTDYEVKRNMP